MPSPQDPSIGPRSLPKGPENLDLHKNLHACTWIFTAAFLITAQIWKQPRCASLVAQLVKNPPAVWETWVRSLGWEDPLERERLPTPVSGLQSSLDSPWGQKESDRTARLSLQISSAASG